MTQSASELKNRFAKIQRLAGDMKGEMEYQTEGKGANPGEDSVEAENANTGNKSYPSAENKTENKE